MINNIFHSTVFKIAALMCLVSSLAVISMFSSVFISDSAQRDAQAINIAGSLRMQSYRLASKVQAAKLADVEDLSIKTLSIKKLTEQFEKDLTSGVLVSQRTIIQSVELDEKHKQIQANWFTTIKPMFMQAFSVKQRDVISLNEVTQVFVDDIDKLVTMHQQHAEKNVTTIRLIQSIALFATIISMAFAMVIVNRHIKQPLSNLIGVARQIGSGDFTVRADETGKGELALLAQTINNMSHSIYRSQSQLEEHVKRKTKKLARSNDALNLLFDITRKLNGADPSRVEFAPILNQLANVTGIRDLDLCLMTAEGSGPYEHLISTKKTLPDKCVQHDCSDCSEHEQIFPQTAKKMCYQLSYGEENYGVLSVHPSDNTPLDEWQHQLFESVVEQLATGLSVKQQQEQSRRIALMNERTVIARELHDSLAQALSYLKIQVTRLQRLQQKENVQDKIEEVIDELKNGLSSAYRELRELLTTFRLKLDNQTLKEAFEQTIEQLKSRSEDFVFSLNYQVGYVPFSPQEEIHILQIAREATQNAFYHSKGDKIAVEMTINALSQVTLSITDNGVGITGDPSKLNHYGLAIMQERSRNLNGQLSLVNNEPSGTQVLFKFTPAYVKPSEIKIKAV
ncbi:MAG: two-component system nitrate/nitrite sensor histidine kinase NarX [Candidatus Endobugula sp.]|jgi:two-component system nitrate/nitrite sensor histidine kinase NarX